MKRNRSTQLKKGASADSFLRKMSKSDRPKAELVYRVVPESGDQHEHAQREEKSWRIKLTNVETDELMALELHGDIVVGLGSENEHDLDVNVADWHGEERGVSRRHCRLRPSSSNLFVMDLQSTNGTHVNGIELGEGQARALQDGDLVTLGRLHLRVSVVQSP